MARIRNVTIDCEHPEKLAEFWQAVTGYALNFSNEYIADLQPPSEDAPHILLLKVPEAKTSKNRVHMDLEAVDRVAEVKRLVDLGATEGETHHLYGLTWTVMQDPEQNEFCVSEPHD